MNQLLIDINNYEKLNRIGEGEFGEVFIVQKKGSDEQIAAKISLREISPNSQDSIYLKREIDIMSRIHHPSIIKFMGYSKVNFNNEPKPVILTEYIKNRSLQTVLELESKALCPDHWNNLKKLINIYGIASGMKYLHSNNILHRDLKPLNILMDDILLPKIADFGLSKYNHQDEANMILQSENDIKGTPPYIAPEIWEGGKYSNSSDVYAFGIIVYEIMTSLPPYPDCHTSYMIANKVMAGNRPKFPLNFQIHEPYKNLIEKCWSHDANKRPTFDEIVDELRNNENFIYDDIDIDYFLDYIEFVDESVITYDSEKPIIDFDDYLITRNNLKKKKSLSNLFGLLNREYKPKDIYPRDAFAILDANCKKLVIDAKNDPEKQFMLGKNLIQGENFFSLNIDLGVQYLNESISLDCIDAGLYYSDILFKGEIIQQNIDKAKHILSNFLKEKDSRIHFLYAKIMKKKNKLSETMKYLEMASKEGNTEAMYKYAKMIMEENNRNKKIDEALDYLEISKINGNEKSEKFLDIIDRMNIVDGFINLPWPAKKFIVSQIFKYEKDDANEKNSRTNITIEPEHLKALFTNRMLNLTDFTKVLKTFNHVEILIDFNMNKFHDIYNNIERYIAGNLQNAIVSLNISEVKAFKFINTNNYNSLINIIIIDPSVKKIADYAFKNFTHLYQISIPNSITYLGEHSLEGCCSLNRIVIPSSVSTINDYTFYQCTSLANIEIPPSLTSIKSYTFAECTSLRKIIIPSAVQSIGQGSFNKCTSLTQISLPSSLEVIERFVFDECTSLRQITIPSSIAIIKKYAFNNCTSLERVIFENNYCQIDNSSFSNCTSLVKITANNQILMLFYQIGHNFYKGIGVTINKQEACRYFKLAADNECLEAMYIYGNMLYNGNGVQINKAESNRYYKIAADSGYTDAILAYGINLQYGNGVQVNKTESTRYFKNGAENGNKDSMFYYGYNLDKGNGVRKI